MSTQPNQVTNEDGAASPIAKPPPGQVFIYGTLCAPPLLAWALTGDASNVATVAGLVRPARVSGFKRVKVRNCDFPAVIRHVDPPSEVDGYLLQLETPSQRRKLDDFEGGLYQAISVNVNLLDPQGKPSGEIAVADMYIWNGAMEELSPSPGSWRPSSKSDLTTGLIYLRAWS